MVLQKKILIVEDDLTLAQQLTEALVGLGYDVSHALTGRDALSQAKRKRFDLCLIDYKLEDTNGGVVLKKLKAQKTSCRFIIVSGKTHIEKALEEQNALGLADAVISKPFKPDALFSTIDSLLAD